MKKNFEKKIERAFTSLRKYSFIKPEIGIILGSGLGAFISKIEGIEIPYSQIKDFPKTTIKGHNGVLKLSSKLAVCAGRFHLYEGYSVDDVVLPVFLLHRLGVRTLILTNAAGAINDYFHPGDFILIKDHINFMGQNPLTGVNPDHLGPRFPDSSHIYDGELRTKAAGYGGKTLAEGVYAGMLGPSYETPAEIQMLKKMGADMVGMSTVPEALAAAYLGMKVLGISTISNMAAGITQENLCHEDVLAMGKKTAETFTAFLTHVVNILSL